MRTNHIFALIRRGTEHIAFDYRMTMCYEGQLPSANKLPTCAADRRMLTSPVRQLYKADDSTTRCSYIPTQSLVYQAR